MTQFASWIIIFHISYLLWLRTDCAGCLSIYFSFFSMNFQSVKKKANQHQNEWKLGAKKFRAKKCCVAEKKSFTFLHNRDDVGLCKALRADPPVSDSHACDNEKKLHLAIFNAPKRMCVTHHKTKIPDRYDKTFSQSSASNMFFVSSFLSPSSWMFYIYRYLHRLGALSKLSFSFTKNIQQINRDDDIKCAAVVWTLFGLVEWIIQSSWRRLSPSICVVSLAEASDISSQWDSKLISV